MRDGVNSEEVVWGMMMGNTRWNEDLENRKKSILRRQESVTTLNKKLWEWRLGKQNEMEIRKW